jgi:tRNA pseudouridine38-40 synthase
MRNILLDISYDGTRFHGWQKQRGSGAKTRTVQEEIERALCAIHGGKDYVRVFGSGRTDAGVHAAHQAANFFLDGASIPAEKYPVILNNALPRDIRIHGAVEKPVDFHARFSAVSRTYRYFFRAGNAPAAFESPFVWHIRKTPRILRLNAMAAFLFGEIDCASFASSGDESLSTQRYIEKAVFFSQGNNLVFEIRANAFLWKMVRTLAGTLIQFEREERDTSYFKEVLDSRDRKRSGITAPPHGLFLWNVEFEGKRIEVNTRYPIKTGK